MPLGVDSTETYYLRLNNPTLPPTGAQLQRDPVRTTPGSNKGLPPTPIANPGLGLARAPPSPADTDYLYFVVVKPDGQLGFATTSAAFQPLAAGVPEHRPLLRAPTGRYQRGRGDRRPGPAFTFAGPPQRRLRRPGPRLGVRGVPGAGRQRQRPRWTPCGPWAWPGSR